MRIGIVVPHIFMQDVVLPHVIFSPGMLALDLADELVSQGQDVTLYTPGPVATRAHNSTADMSYFEQELAGRGYGYAELMKKHPLTFVSLARQVQAEIIAKAFTDANEGALDIVHIYTNEEDIALPFVRFCAKPVVLTHHDPFSLLVRYKNNFPKYRHLNWCSISYAQRLDMPEDTNWVANIYHGVKSQVFTPVKEPSGDYVLFYGRIIAAKGTHLAIRAIEQYNASHPKAQLKLKIAGRHYAGESKDTYWREQVEPYVGTDEVEYVGFVKDSSDKRTLLANAAAVIMPSTFEEPFGMVAIEAMACGTPVICLDSGALAEVITNGETGIVVPKVVTRDNTGREVIDEQAAVSGVANGISAALQLDRRAIRRVVEKRFTTERMAQEHVEMYEQLTI